MNSRSESRYESTKHLELLRLHACDGQVPLDGTQWSRLANMRMLKEQTSNSLKCRDKTSNLLVRMQMRLADRDIQYVEPGQEKATKRLAINHDQIIQSYVETALLQKGVTSVRCIA